MTGESDHRAGRSPFLAVPNSYQQASQGQNRNQNNSSISPRNNINNNTSNNINNSNTNPLHIGSNVRPTMHLTSMAAAITMSPLGQKTPSNLHQREREAASLTTPNHHRTPAISGQQLQSQQQSSGLLGSMSKNGLFASALPSSLRKVSFQREYRDPVIMDGNTTTLGSNVPKNSLNYGNPIDNDGLTTTLITTTSAAELENGNNSNINTGTGTNEPFDFADMSTIDKLQSWRQDALFQHLYSTAEFIGNKILSMTNDSTDAFWLAQIYYQSGEYTRAIDLLSNSTSSVGGSAITNNWVTISIPCRYLMGLCLVELKKFDEALDIIGEETLFIPEPINNSNTTNNQSTTNNTSEKSSLDAGIDLESSMSYLRGRIYLYQNNFNKAKTSFINSILIDIKNFEAYEQLTSKNLLTPKEELDLLNKLDFSTLDDNEELIKNLYYLRLKNLISVSPNSNLIDYNNQIDFKESKNILIEQYNLENNIDILLFEIENYYNSCKFEKCIDYCEKALEIDAFNKNILTVYISSLYEQDAKNKLFLISHKLSQNLPNSEVTWFSIRHILIFSINKINEARKNFSKSSLIDSSFAPAWLGFAHTFAIENEHDQAISAYSTASRFFQGMNSPNLFLGMQYMSINTLSLAEEYFILSYDINPNDPLLLNEMGVLYFKKSDLQKSKKFLKRALDASNKSLNPNSKTALSIQINLAHTFRKLNEFEKSVQLIKSVLEISGKNSNLLCNLGFLYLKLRQFQYAIDNLHTALSINPSNQLAQELLIRALELNVLIKLDSDHPLNFLQSNSNQINADNNKKISESNFSTSDTTSTRSSTNSRKRSNKNILISDEFSKKLRTSNFFNNDNASTSHSASNISTF
ncbi:hypothetical protein TBLA_0C01010 [Henningerozyma blattae CBS 6284]|uniref:Uncharacterized protein n=1 Tax=Henningerozyma blattae (strain ATCC 34711 / CBS 6284 / DSM 70876 / NBRC 10599 / NRRL Y-10934 / UCD 77-7) TaxID=1071380 RepID=I2H0L4_HENB6|nr:hypothetical protein TBLA_0C01010 [Tetrapisispora blattae CBS 6284]CCH59916.1 hypothetical protein TBLA_0C01010 [Tetrapisispora blattae CBS 6284]